MENKKEELLNELLTEVSNLNQRAQLDALRKRALMITEKIFGKETGYLNTISKIRFSPSITYSGMEASRLVTAFESGKKQLLNTINVMIEDLKLSHELIQPVVQSKTKNDYIVPVLNKIFIVHGHNEAMKQSVARFVERIKYQPIILHEQASKGSTIIEKFTNYADVPFAIVLLSADDLGISKDSNLKKAKLRARQNVIFELGFFLGKLGREKVVVLHEIDENFEFPSDYQGVVYIGYDHNENWKFSIIKEMKAAGHTVDANDLL